MGRLWRAVQKTEHSAVIAKGKQKLKKAIKENVGIDYGRAKTYTVGSWLEVWMENYAKVKLRPSTFKTGQGFLKNHIKPQIGSIPLADLTSLDLQSTYAGNISSFCGLNSTKNGDILNERMSPLHVTGSGCIFQTAEYRTRLFFAASSR